MKIINNERGYATSIFVLLMLLPLIMLMIIIIDEYTHETENTVNQIESDKIKSKTEDFEKEIITATKEALHETTLEVITTGKPIKNSRTNLKQRIEEKLHRKEEKYRKDNIIIDSSINMVESSDDPFKIEIKYEITLKSSNTDIKITKNDNRLIEITDTKHPVYDPLPILKTQALYKDTRVYYQDKLDQHLSLENNDAYHNSISYNIIKKCPYEDYTQHGNSNQTIINCIKNHYYHNSHDGLCILCRLENRTTCNHYGFETFIIPTKEYDRAPVSIDHVLLNDENAYMGNKIKINDQIILYLDNGHLKKYEL